MFKFINYINIIELYYINMLIYLIWDFNNFLLHSWEDAKNKGEGNEIMSENIPDSNLHLLQEHHMKHMC